MVACVAAHSLSCGERSAFAAVVSYTPLVSLGGQPQMMAPAVNPPRHSPHSVAVANNTSRATSPSLLHALSTSLIVSIAGNGRVLDGAYRAFVALLV
jgi:hypothetical protein